MGENFNDHRNADPIPHAPAPIQTLSQVTYTYLATKPSST